MKSMVKKQKGITLIALVVTIVVLIILATISISVILGDNGLIARAEKAKQTMENEKQEELGALGDYEKLLSDGVNASDISTMNSEQVKNIYGKYITNYNPAGNAGIGGDSPVSEYKWQIFYADGEHIYLIASDYINNPPNSKNKSITTTENEFEFSMDQVIMDYEGSNSIKSEDIKKLNGNYYEFLKAENRNATNPNMKAVAYMMDTSIWNPLFCDTTFGSYAIGTPTLELLCKSYNQKSGDNYLVGSKKLNDDLATKTMSGNGYYVSADEGATWKVTIADNDKLSLDSTYNIKNGKSYRMSLASPCGDGMKLIYRLTNGGAIAASQDCTLEADAGSFRPIVCLKSDVKIEKDGENYKLTTKKFGVAE